MSVQFFLRAREAEWRARVVDLISGSGAFEGPVGYDEVAVSVTEHFDNKGSVDIYAQEGNRPERQVKQDFDVPSGATVWIDS